VIPFVGKYFSAWVFAVFLFILYMTLPVKTPRAAYAVVISLAVTGGWSLLQQFGTYVTLGCPSARCSTGPLEELPYSSHGCTCSPSHPARRENPRLLAVSPGSRRRTPARLLSPWATGGTVGYKKPPSR